ncbi:MAG: ATP-binding cassette domain-containing protein [Eubacteriales bacterium]|nr:ATP-binding cassette domain-containing protein [Eubacteriales bacterium]
MSLIVDIRKKAGDFLLDVSFETAGGVHALLGSSGSGKSMTLKCIAGIITPDEGQISLDGKVLFDSKKKINLPPQKRSVGYMFQDYALFPTMTVLQNVMAAMGKRKDPEKAMEYLQRFHVQELADRYPEKLSGGQKQRVAMARITAQEPSLILLDEPFAALDSHLKWVLQNEMKTTLERMRIPAVMVTHSRDEVFRLCTSVCCLRAGHSENTRAMRDFFKNPETVTGAMLSGCKNVSRVAMIDGHTLRALDWEADLYFRNGLPEDAASGIRAVGIRAHRFHTEKRPEDDNTFEIGDHTVLEDPFEWNLSFFKKSCRSNGETGTEHAAGSESESCAVNKNGTTPAVQPLLWRVAKKENGFTVPERLYLNSDQILLLRE